MDKKNHNLDHAEYIRLLMGSQAQICAYIQALVQNFQDAEDIFQETAVIAWEKFDEYTPGSSFIAWAITIARYRIMYYWNKNKHSIIHYSDATVKSIEDYMARRAEKLSSDLSHLDDCLKKLSAGDVQLIQTRYSRKMTIKRMAEELGRSVQGLYSTLSRIHLMLAECIQRQRLVQER